MVMAKFSTQLPVKRIQALKRMSEQTHIPQSALLDRAIRLLQAQFVTDVVTPEFRRLVDQTIQEDLPALRRLAK